MKQILRLIYHDLEFLVKTITQLLDICDQNEDFDASGTIKKLVQDSISQLNSMREEEESEQPND